MPEKMLALIMMSVKFADSSFMTDLRHFFHANATNLSYNYPEMYSGYLPFNLEKRKDIYTLMYN